MNINDLNKVLEEYLKHFGKDKFNEYFKQAIQIKNKGEKDAIGKKKTNNSSRSD